MVDFLLDLFLSVLLLLGTGVSIIMTVVVWFIIGLIIYVCWDIWKDNKKIPEDKLE